MLHNVKMVILKINHKLNIFKISVLNVLLNAKHVKKKLLNVYLVRMYNKNYTKMLVEMIVQQVLVNKMMSVNNALKIKLLKIAKKPMIVNV